MDENRKRLFRATATPLASIFGSGFLVIVPILNGAVGPYSLVAMACVCALAYAVGSIIRYNIRYAEPIFEAGDESHRAFAFERLSDFSLVIAYTISVCLYVRILAAFNTLTIIALASRALAFYYALQCLVAVNVTENRLHKLAMRLLAVVLLFITIFAVPAG